MNDEAHLIKQALAELNLPTSDKVIEQLIAYVDMLDKWRKKVNLVGNVTRSEIWIKHIFDSLATHSALLGPSCLDLGSGAGLPGIPLAIVLPNYQYLLVEPRGKRAHFLRQVVNSLQLKHVEIRHERAENLQLAAGVTTIVSRAVADLSTLVSWSEHLLAPNGRWVLMKGPKGDAVETVEQAHLSLQFEPIVVPFLKEVRQVLIAEQV